MTEEELILALDQAIDLAEIKLTTGIFKDSFQVESTKLDYWMDYNMPELAKYIREKE